MASRSSVDHPDTMDVDHPDTMDVDHPDTMEGHVQMLDPCTGRRSCLDSMESMKMSYELLKTITGNFSKDNVLGSGSFGVVYKGLLHGKEIAVKILRDMAALDGKAFRNEFQNLARLDHGNIVQLVGYCNESEKQTVARDDGTKVIAEKMHVALCFQYVDNGSLDKHISDEYEGLEWHIRYKIIKGICEGLKHLRVGLESHVLHLDLKPENILLDKEMVPKIADFGLSRLIGEERTKQTINSVGTRGYWPPEYVKFQLLSETFDIFSLGVIVTKIMIGNEGYHSFADMLPRKLIKHVHNNWTKRLQKTENLTSLELEAYSQQVKTCIEMASKCLSEDRKQRPSIQEIVDALNETEIMIRNIQLQREKKVSHTYVMEKYSYELLRRMTDDFSEGRLIGSGGFGSVYKGIHEDGREIAVKVFRYFSTFFPERFQAEVETVARFQHENIIQLAGYCYESEQEIVAHEGRLIVAERIRSAICFEYLQNGSLEQYILDKSDGLDWCTRYKIIKGICNGLRYLHEGLSGPIVHFNLKPRNILLDGNMVPKIADFAMEKLFGEDARRTIMGFSKTTYLPPEFLKFQLISKAFDMYSLGIIILEMMAGISAHSLLDDMISKDFIDFVLSKWRKRLEATLKERRLLVEIYCHQVKICIEIALNCVEVDRSKRPNIGDVISVLDKTEKKIHDAESKWKNDEDSRASYTKNSSDSRHMIRNYSYKLLKEMTNDFSEDRLLGQGWLGKVYRGVNEDGREIAVKVVDSVFSGVDSHYFQNELHNVGMLQHENIVQLVGYCDETENILVEYNGRHVVAEKIQRALCFEYLQNGSLEKHISDEYSGLDWCGRYKILKGICQGLRYLHEELPGPIYHLDIKPMHILLDENMAPNISGFALSRCLQECRTAVTSSVVGTLGYMPPEHINKGIISAKHDIYSLGATIIYMLTGRRAYSIDDIISKEFIEDVLKNWRRRLQGSLKSRSLEGRSLEGYLQQLKKCLEIASQCMQEDRHKRPNIGAIVRMLDETETVIMIRDAGKLLDVQPMELRYPLKPKRYASTLLRLRNRVDDRVAFRLVSEGQKMYHTNLPLLGIVPPRCTYIIALTLSTQQKRPRLDGDEGLLLQSVAVSRHQCFDQALVVREFQSLFKKAQESDDDEVQAVTLKFVSSPPADEEASSKLSRPEIEIITAPDAQEVSSIEVHPKEPWIMTTHERGNLRIWNYQTLAILNPIKLPQESVYVAKFIAQEEWIVAGDSNGFIHVFSYDEYQETTSFEAHNGQIMSLAVHPKDSYVLSSSNDDHLIKLWHWDKYWDFEKGPWVCTRTFEGHSNKVSHVIFNPDGTDSFTSASWDGTVKVWGGLNSDVCNTIALERHPDGLLSVDYITGADPQHLITGSKDQTAQIWDLEIKRCREYLQGHAHHVSVVYCHQELQKLFTGSLDGTLRIWDSTTYRLENIIALNLGAVSGVRYIDELQRIVVGCHKGIAMMEMKFGSSISCM